MIAAVAIGVDIGGTSTKIARVTADGTPLCQEKIATVSDRDPTRYLDTLANLVGDRIHDDVCGIGISLPGFLSEDRLHVELNSNTPALEGVDLVARFRDFGLPISVEQDLNAVALGEFHYGTGRGASRLLCVAIGTGLGAALLVEGEPVRFTGTTIGDTGHVILDPHGPRCSAGCRGCAEALVSTSGIAALVPSRPTANTLTSTSEAGEVTQRVVAAARAGTDWAVQTIAAVGSHLGQWLASMTPIFLPDRIVLSGGIAESGNALLESSEQRFRELAGPAYAECELVTGALRSAAGVVGAAVPFLKGS